MFELDIKTVCGRILENRVVRRFPGDLKGIRDAFEVLNGLESGNCIIISGRPGMGKTSLILTMINKEIDAGRRVLFFLNRESAELIIQRLVSIRTGIPIAKVLQCDPEVEDEVKKELLTLQHRRIAFHEGQFTDNEVRKIVAASEDIDILCIDDFESVLDGKVYDNVRTYDEIMREYDGGYGERYLNSFYDGDKIAIDPTNVYLGNLLEDLKDLGVRNNFSIVCAIQHSKIVDYKSDHRPEVADLRKYGRIDLAADYILFPFRGVYYRYLDEYEDRSDIEVVRAENGGRTYYNVTWKEETAEYVDWTPHYEDFDEVDYWEAEEQMGLLSPADEDIPI